LDGEQIKSGFGRKGQQFRHGEAVGGDWGGIDDPCVRLCTLQGYGQMVERNRSAIV
jgi:hypothetical protein